MNTLIYYSFSPLILSVLVLIIGLIKPKWILIWMEKPERWLIVAIAMVLFMIGAVLYGEGNKQLRQEKALQNTTQSSQPASDAPPAEVGKP